MKNSFGTVFTWKECYFWLKCMYFYNNKMTGLEARDEHCRINISIVYLHLQIKISYFNSCRLAICRLKKDVTNEYYRLFSCISLLFCFPKCPFFQVVYTVRIEIVCNMFRLYYGQSIFPSKYLLTLTSSYIR